MNEGVGAAAAEGRTVDEPTVASRLRVVQAVDLVKLTPLLVIGNLIAVGLTVLAGHDVYADNPIYLAPVALLIVVLIPTGLLWIRLRHKAQPKMVSRRHIRRIVLSSLLMGLSWAGTFAIVYPVLSPFQQVIVVMIGGFLGMGSIGAIASNPAACIAYFAPYWAALMVSAGLYSPGVLLPIMLGGAVAFAFALNAGYRRVFEYQQVQAENERMVRQRHAAERAEQEALLQAQRNLIEALPFPVVVTRGDSVFEASPAARRQFGTDEAQLPSLSIADFFVDAGERDAMIELQQRDGRLDDVEVRFRDSEGRAFWGTCTTRRFIYMGEPSWLISIYVIDERKRMEQDLAQAKERAEAALLELQAAQTSLLHSEKMASIGKLTAGVAHEIKNPLNFINNFALLSRDLVADLLAVVNPLKEGLVEDDRAELDEVSQMLTDNLERINEHGQRADRIVKGMLMHSRGGTTEKQKSDLNVLIEDALNLAYHGARAADQGANVTIETALDETVGEIAVAPQELTRVLVNLINNAFYAARERAGRNEDGFEPTLKVSSERIEGGVEIRVRDNGTGVPEDVRDQLFNPFFTTKPAGEGTGLGLSISYDIVVQQHGGRLEVASQEGAYTEFCLFLPDA